MAERLAAAMLALLAAFLYASSNVLEQRKAAEAPPETSMRVALLWHLARKPTWWLGIGADVGGLVAQVAALGLASLVFVQPILVLALPFSLVLGALAGSHRLSRQEVWLAFLLVAGLAVFLIVASPSGGVDTRPLADWRPALVVVIALVGSSLILARGANGATRAALLGAAAGTMHGVEATVMKGVSHQIGTDGFPAMFRNHWEPWALLVLLPLGFLMVQSAFQAGDLRAALPSLEISEPIVACLLGVGLLHEQLHVTGGGSRLALLLAVIVMIWTTVQLAHSAAASVTGEADRGLSVPWTSPHDHPPPGTAHH